MGADALSRPVYPTFTIYGHITALLGAGLPSDDRVALPVVAQLVLIVDSCTVLDRQQHAAIHCSDILSCLLLSISDVYQIVNQNTSEQDPSQWNVLDHQTCVVGTCVSYVRE